MYDLVRGFYLDLKSGGTNLTKYNATDLSLEEFYTIAAHMKEDMIVR